LKPTSLVKEFPQRTNPDQEKSPRRGSSRFWPFHKRAPKTLFTAVDHVSFEDRARRNLWPAGTQRRGENHHHPHAVHLSEPTSRTARLNGFDIQRQANQVRQSLGTVLAGERSIYWKLTARENLEYFAALYHIPPKAAKARASTIFWSAWS
jgi:ABC-2 type transport system ATP-binding protein